MTSNNDPIRIEQLDGVATLSFRFPSSNRFTHHYVRLLSDKVRLASRDPHVKVLVLRSDDVEGFSAGYSFSVVHESQTEADRIALALAGQQLTTSLRSCGCITVAEVSGPCFGTGLELALACDVRIAEANPRTMIGFPDSRFGLFPSWGGVSDLVKRLGSAGTQRLLSANVSLTAREAVKCGLFDLAFCERRAKIERQTVLDHILAKPRKAKPPGFFAIRRNGKALSRIIPARDFAFARPLASLIRAAQSSVPESLAAERICFAKAIASGPVVASFELQQHSTSATRLYIPTANPIPAIPHVVGVIGNHPEMAMLTASAAINGCRIAVDSGNEVAIYREIADAQHRGLLTPLEAEHVMNRIRVSDNRAEFDRAGLVLCESLTEEGVEQLEAIIPPRCLIAMISNTLDECQEAALRPGRIVGLGLPMPTIDSKLLEVLSGSETSCDSTTTLSTWLRKLGFTTVLGSHRTIPTVRRVMNAYWDEAVRLVSEGIPVAAIDAAVRANGTKKGPLEQLDEIGFENVVDGVKRLMPLLASGMAGRGEGNGHGFYRYKRGVQTREYHAACSILWDARAMAGEGPKDPLASLDLLTPTNAIRVAGERLTLRIVNEAAQCLHENQLANSISLDIAVAWGADLLPFAGGALRFADRRGLQSTTIKLAEFAAHFGPRFAPSPELIRRAAQGIPFHTSTQLQSMNRLAIRAA